jgi:hypothetical protein
MKIKIEFFLNLLQELFHLSGDTLYVKFKKSRDYHRKNKCTLLLKKKSVHVLRATVNGDKIN